MQNTVVVCKTVFVLLSGALVISTIAASSALADTRRNLTCAMNNYLPKGKYSVRTLKSWIPENIKVEFSDNDEVNVALVSGFGIPERIPGEIRRENSNKIEFQAARYAKDNIGRVETMIYNLEWFKSNNKIVIHAGGQGFLPMGRASGNCNGANNRGSAYSKAPDLRVCNMATQNGLWEQKQSLQKWVAEARDRDLSLETCEKVLKVN